MPPPPSSPHRILLIAGSLRARSTNLAVLKTAEALATADTACFLYCGLGELPHFNVDLDSDPLPTQVALLRAALNSADAVLFSFPEYAGSLPGSFKNLLDWTVGGGMYKKPVGYINTSPPGTAQGAQQMFQVVLGFVQAEIIPGACVQIPVRHDAVDSSGLIVDREVRSQIGVVLAKMAGYLAVRPADVAIA